MKIRISDYTKRNTKLKQNFKARETAIIRLKNRPEILKLYELNENDCNFLDKMSSQIKLKKLASIQYPTEILKKWKTMINNAILMSGWNKPQKSFLLTQNNKACGLLTYLDEDITILDYLVTWPTEKGKKVNCAGKSLLSYLFHDSLKRNKKCILLSSLEKSTKNLKQYYKELGFYEIPEINGLNMKATKENIKKTAKQLDEIIDIEEKQIKKEVDLSQEINIKYD